MAPYANAERPARACARAELGGGSVCDPRCHPMWLLQAEQPECSTELSLWLAARLPLSTALRVHLLSAHCPLRRLQDARGWGDARTFVGSDERGNQYFVKKPTSGMVAV